MSSLDNDFYKKKYYKYKNKYINEKNKLSGGVTFKSGKYAFFCDDVFLSSYNNKLFSNYKPDNDAPSISKINSELSLKGYRLENNTNVAKLLISRERSINEMEIDPKFSIGMILGGIAILPVLVVASTGFMMADAAGLVKKINKRDDNQKKLNAEIILKKPINLDNDNEIQDVLSIFDKNDLLKFLNINCCVVIDVNNVFSNKYIKVVKLDKAPPSVTVPTPVKVTTPLKK
jgi:hypothetical protein